LQTAWSQGIAAMAQAGAGIILDVVFLDGAEGQRRWTAVLAGLQVLWVGVMCDKLVAAAREAARGDRVPGMAAQAPLVHRHMAYDLTVDTTQTLPGDCARRIVDRVASGPPLSHCEGRRP
jgi:chloramphenicol 3-O phosphotransferase